MRITLIASFMLVFAPIAVAFSTSTQSTQRTAVQLNAGYVPDGFTPAEWELQKEKDAKKRKHKKHFVSRSLQSFQEEMEKGRVRHLFPTVFAKERIKKHYIRRSDVPYMQRDGSFENTDVNVGYVPDGMTPHQWHDIQRKEQKDRLSKDFGHQGPKGFKSRSLQSFQEDLEKGRVSHLMPVMFAKERLKAGFIKDEDVPYMQRGGSWDNSDVKGAEKVAWTDTDCKYEGVEHPPDHEAEVKSDLEKGFWERLLP